MALEINDLREVFSGNSPGKRMIPKEGGGTAVGELAVHSGAPLLPEGTPLAFNSSSSKWQVYTQPRDEMVMTITSGATPATAGSFKLIINGHYQSFPFDVTAASVQGNLRATLADVYEDAALIAAVATTGTDLGDASAVITITFPPTMGVVIHGLDTKGLTGAVHVSAVTDAGTALNGTNIIRAFVGDEGGRQTDATDEVQVLLFKAGTVHRDDVNNAAILLVLGGSTTEGELDTALVKQSVRDVGIDIQALAGVN